MSTCLKRLMIAVLALGASVAVAGNAAASPVTINIGSFTGIASGSTAVLHAPGTLANNLNVYLGSVPITGDLGSFWSYCVDLQHYEIVGANDVIVNTMDNWNNTANPPHAGLGGRAASWLYKNEGPGAVGNSTNQAALSLAIWNSLYDDDYTVLGGTGFWATSLAHSQEGTLADQYLGDLSTFINGGGTLPNALWLQTSNTRGATYAQDYIAPDPVPEPGTLILLLTGMGGVAFRRRGGRVSL